MKKFLAIVLSAVLFGGVAGGTMYGVNRLANQQTNQAAVIELPAESAEAEANADAADVTKDGIAGTADTETAANAEGKTSTAVADAVQAALKIKPGTETAADASEANNAKSAYGVRLDVSDIVEDAMPQLVSITNTMLIKQNGYSSLFDYFYGGGYIQEYEVPASGSGVILDKTDTELLIVTNNHVVADSKELQVTFIDGETVDAAIKGTDDEVDLAVIAVKLDDIPEETMDAIKISKLHVTDDLKPGQGVIAIGNALGFGQTVTVGYISALNREIQAEGTTYSDLIQVDAAINPGNSGGALINMDGEVIGINVAKLSNTAVEGVGYSIPIYKVTDVLDNLSNAKTKVEVAEEDQGRLGIYMNTVTSENAAAFGIPAGVIITGFSSEEFEGVNPDNVQASPAEDAGLLKNDIVTAFDGQKVTNAQQLQQLVKYYEAGSKVDVTVQRLNDGKYEEKTVTVTLGGKNDKSIASDAARKAYEKLNPQSGNEEEETEAQAPQDGKKPGQKPAKPEANAEEGTESENNAAGAEEGTDEETPSQSGRGSMDEIYDLFRQFMDQYH